MMFAGTPAALVAFVALYGFGTGVVTVARALLPLSLFSLRDYGLQASRLSLPQNVANAAAPVVFTALLDRAGALAALGVGAVLSAVALGCMLLLSALVRKAHRRSETYSVTARSLSSAR
jgi:MFS family permease